MSLLAEKKWFVYIGDHHEGPFSIEEIHQKILSGMILSDYYVWTEGMSDWASMHELPEFSSVFEPVKPTPPPMRTPTHTVSTEPHQAPTQEAAAASPDEPHQAYESQEANSEDGVAPPEQGFSDMDGMNLEPRDPEFTSSIHELKISPDDVHPGEEISQESDPTEDPQSAEGNSHFSQFKTKRVLKIGLQLFIPIVFLVSTFLVYNDLSSQTSQLQPIIETYRPTLLSIAERFPVLSPYISPLQPLPETSPEEYEELKSAVREKLDAAGAKVSLALSRHDIQFPTFYISSNLPDGAQFKIYIVGKGDTLLNQTSYLTQGEVVLSRGLGKTSALKQTDGKPIPRGEYVLFVTPSENQPKEIKKLLEDAPAGVPTTTSLLSELPKNLKILTQRAYFLGGLKDDTYFQRLKEYHTKLRTKAQSEIQEVKQFALTLQSQFESTKTKFQLIRKGRVTPAQKKNWDSFHNEWIRIENKLDQAFLTWTPEAVQAEFFYSALYLLIKNAGLEIRRLHDYQNMFYFGKPDIKTFPTQLASLIAGAESALQFLMTKIQHAENLTPTSNGMPRKDGL